MYDPVTRRVISPDNLIPEPDNTQAYNRYTYCYNNPLKYTDPDGNEPITAAIIIGAAIGAYAGGKVAHANGYDFNDWQTYAYIAGGAVVGGASGGLGASIATSGVAGAKTAAIVFASHSNSMGMAALSQGKTSVGVSFGFASYNYTNNEWNGIWNWSENSTLENIGYSLGAFANFTDVMGAINTPNETHQLHTDNTELKGGFDPGHSAFTKNGKPSLSFGPAKSDNPMLKKLFGSKSSNQYPVSKSQKPIIDVGLNSDVVNSMDKFLPKTPYAAGFGLQCASATTLAGVMSGHYLPNIFLTVLNAPQLTYYSYLYEQQITTMSILAVTHTTK
jgi:hypothetical protein